jgi:hypothetical protein
VLENAEETIPVSLLFNGSIGCEMPSCTLWIKENPVAAFIQYPVGNSAIQGAEILSN